MDGECHESGRVLIYQWKFKDLAERSSIMTEMAEFLGLKAFRFALKRTGGGQDSKSKLYFICTNLHKTGFKVAKVSVKIKGKPDQDGHMSIRDNELDHLQLFFKEIDCEWQKQETLTFGVHVIETLENYRYQLSDILFTDQLWLAAKNKLWTDIEFSVQNHIYSAHRAILAARSQTFFVSIESLIVGSRIKIEHIDPLAFEMFLQFLYTGVFQVCNRKSINEDVLKLAERYKLSTLKSLCQLAVQDIDASQLTSFAMAMKPDFEICPRKPQLK